MMGGQNKSDHKHCFKLGVFIYSLMMEGQNKSVSSEK